MRVRKQVPPLVVLVLALALLAPLAGAQPGAVLIDGSPALFPFLQTTGLAYTEATGVEVVVNISGEDAAFAALCANTLDAVNAARPISEDEIALCQQNGVRWIELLIALDGLAVHHANLALEAPCLSLDDLAEAFGDSQTELYGGLAVYGRGREYRQFMARALGLDALRDDLQAANTDADVLAALNTAPGPALAYTSLAAALTAGLSPLAVQADPDSACVEPSAASVATGDYPLGRKLYVYVNLGSGEQPAVAAFIDYLLSPENLSRLPDLELVRASETDYMLAAHNWSRRTPGQTFSAPPALSVATTAIEGQDLTLYDGVAELSPVLQAAVERITASSPGLQYDLAASGTNTALARFCNAELDLAGARRAITDAEMATCASNNVEFIELLLGLNPLVVVTNRANDYATCLNMAQLNLVFGAANQGLVRRWEQLQDGFPPFDLAVYTPLLPAATAFAEMMGPLRTDVLGGDVATAVAADEAGIGFTTYADYQAHQGALRAVAVNAGAGCVEPTPANVRSGAYPLTQPLYLYVNAESAMRPAVQALALDAINPETVEQASFLPVSDLEYMLSLDALQTRTTGPLHSR